MPGEGRKWASDDLRQEQGTKGEKNAVKKKTERKRINQIFKTTQAYQPNQNLSARCDGRSDFSNTHECLTQTTPLYLLWAAKIFAAEVPEFGTDYVLL